MNHEAAFRHAGQFNQSPPISPPISPEGLLSQISRPLAFEALRTLHEITEDTDPFNGAVLFIGTHYETAPELNDIGILKIGTPKEDIFDFAGYATEKASRVFKRYCREGDVEHYLASQSANPNLGRYPGCVVAEDTGSWGICKVLMFISGANGFADEAFCFVSAELLGLTVCGEYANEMITLEEARNAMKGVVTED